MLQTPKRKMQPEYAFLYPTESAGGKSKIVINNTKFVIGRSQGASFDIPHVSISRNHCTFSFENQTWLLTDQSSSGTFVNGKKMICGSTLKINSNDIIQFGNYQKAFEFRFVSSNFLETEKMKKKIKTEEVIVHSKSSVGNNTIRTTIVGEDELDGPKLNIEDLEQVTTNIYHNSAKEHTEFPDGSPNLYECCLSNKETNEETLSKEYLKNKIKELEQKYEEEKNQLKDKLAEGTLEQKRIFEEKLKLMREKEEIQNRLLQEKLELEKKVKEMQELLDRKAAEGAEHVRNLEQKCLQQEAQNQEIVKQLVADLNEKELAAKSLLDSYLKNLQEDKEKLEKEIREQLLKKEDESKTKVEQLQQELCNIKENLTTVEQKKECLEKELEEAVKAKEFASSSNLKTKEEVLNNFSDLLEAELQCSICNELFVTATILNCTHTFCKYCITLWKKKKAECPVCRTKITSENSSLALDNFIGRMVENLSDELKRKREEIKEERSVIEIITSMSAKSKQKGRRHQTTPINSSDTNESNEFILISSDSENSSSSIWDTDPDDTSLSSEEGLESEYYGGYGRCYICGRRGHWARGCPNR